MEKNFSTGAVFITNQLEADAQKLGGVLITLGHMNIRAVGNDLISRADWWINGESCSKGKVLEALDNLTVKATGGTH